MTAPSLSRPGNPTPGGPYPSPQPSGPKPPPTPPPTIYALAEACGFGDLQIPARPTSIEGDGTQGGPVSFPSSNGRAGALTRRPGAVSDGVPAVLARDDGRAVGAGGAATFLLPVPVGPPRFGGDDPPQPGRPGPPPTPPFPPPPLGVGPLYDALPGSPR